MSSDHKQFILLAHVFSSLFYNCNHDHTKSVIMPKYTRRSFYYGHLSDWLIVKTKVKQITLLGKLNFCTSEIQTFSRKKFFFTKRFFLLVNLLIPSFWLGCLVVADIVFDRNTGRKTFKTKCLFESNLRCFIPCKCFIGLDLQEQSSVA